MEEVDKRFRGKETYYSLGTEKTYSSKKFPRQVKITCWSIAKNSQDKEEHYNVFHAGQIQFENCLQGELNRKLNKFIIGWQYVFSKKERKVYLFWHVIALEWQKF